jgi:hypothetical protein
VKNLLKAFRNQQPYPGSLAFQNSVGGYGCPVEDIGNLSGVNAGIAADLLDPRQNPNREICRSTGCLGQGGSARFLIEEQKIREGSSYVNPQPISHRILLLIVYCRYSQTSMILAGGSPFFKLLCY